MTPTVAMAQRQRVDVVLDKQDADTLLIFLTLHPYDLPPQVQSAVRYGLREWQERVDEAREAEAR